MQPPTDSPRVDPDSAPAASPRSAARPPADRGADPRTCAAWRAADRNRAQDTQSARVTRRHSRGRAPERIFNIYIIHIRVKNGGTYAKVWLTSCSGDGCLCSRCFILCLCKHAIYHFPSEMQPQRCNGVWINTICVQYKYKLSSLLDNLAYPVTCL